MEPLRTKYGVNIDGKEFVREAGLEALKIYLIYDLLVSFIPLFASLFQLFFLILSEIFYCIVWIVCFFVGFIKNKIIKKSILEKDLYNFDHIGCEKSFEEQLRENIQKEIKEINDFLIKNKWDHMKDGWSKVYHRFDIKPINKR
jgi:hypothetical protein